MESTYMWEKCLIKLFHKIIFQKWRENKEVKKKKSALFITTYSGSSKISGNFCFIWTKPMKKEVGGLDPQP